MATKKQKKEWDEGDYRTYRNKWSNKSEYDDSSRILKRVDEMKTRRENSSPWAVEEDSSEEGVNTSGTDWKEVWDKSYKQWSMYHVYLDDEPNLKSPTSFAPIQAGLAEFYEHDIVPSITHTREEDKDKAKVYEAILNAVEKRAKTELEKRSSYHECEITGTSFMYWGYLTATREVELAMEADDLEDLTEEQIETLGKNKPVTEKKEVVDYDDLTAFQVSVYEIYVDPDARTLRGPSFQAEDIAWVSYPSTRQVKNEFNSIKDPYVIKGNLSKIKSAKGATEGYSDTPFFTTFDEAMEDRVQLIRYYNRLKDEYTVLANEVVIRKGPLPLNHKELPFTLHRYLKWPNMFYGVGLPMVLESLQSEDEAIRNMMLTQLHIAINPPIFVNTSIMEDVADGWDRVQPGLRVEVSGETNENNIRWFTAPQIGYDAFRVRDEIRSDQIVVSGVNPAAYSVPSEGEAVRNNLMGMESTLKMLKMTVKNWSEGYIEGLQMWVKIIQQMYPVKKLEMYFPIQNGRIDSEGKFVQDQENNTFQLRGEYLDLEGDLDITVDVDSVVPMSKSVMIQKIETAIAQLTPLLMNPMAMQNPAMVELVHEYADYHGLNPRITESLMDSSSKKEAQAAEDQEELMLEGENVPGIPGESFTHKYHHSMRANYLYMVRDELIKEGATPEDIAAISEAITKITKHLEEDSLPKTATLKSAPEVPTPGNQPGPVPVPEQGQVPTGGPGQVGGGANSPIGPSSAGPNLDVNAM